MELNTRIRQLTYEHGGLRAAARAIGMSPSYLIRLRDGEKMEPSNNVLGKLGLQKKVTYTKLKDRMYGITPTDACQPHKTSRLREPNFSYASVPQDRRDQGSQRTR